VRKTLRGAEPWDDGDARRRLDWDGGQTLTFRIAVGPEGSARPIEALTALFGVDIAGRSDLARLGLRSTSEGRGGGPYPDPSEPPAMGCGGEAASAASVTPLS